MSAPKKKQALLVEDSLEEVFLMRAFMEKTGIFQVTHAQDGDLAAKLIQERMWDLVVTDLNLPGVDGYDLIRMIKARAPATPVLAMTGYTATHYVDQAYRAGADHILHKPVNRDEFVAKVTELAGKLDVVPDAPKPEPKKEEPKPAFVLAIGALPGDIEGGCGGTLLSARAKGQGVLLIPLSATVAADATVKEAQRRSAESMGARVIMTGTAVTEADNPAEHQLLLERIVRELKPLMAFVPSLADDNPHRREAHRISRTAVADVPIVLAYETGTSNHQFAPSRFLDVGAHIEKKLEVLTAYESQGRPDLDPEYVMAAARHWGRHVKFGEAEAFEVLRDGGTDA